MSIADWKIAFHSMSVITSPYSWCMTHHMGGQDTLLAVIPTNESFLQSSHVQRISGGKGQEGKENT